MNEQRDFAISIDTAYTLVYGRRGTAETLAVLRDTLGSTEVRDLSSFRKIIMRLDRQAHPTAALIRFGAADLRRVQIEGLSLLLDASDYSVSAAIFEHGTYETHVTGVFRRYLQRGSRVVDVGANVGYFTMLAASIVGPDGEVLAFDPNSENARLILMNAAENKFGNVRLFPLALAERTGHAYFSSHIGSNGGFLAGDQEQLADGRGLVVPTARLDDLVKSPVDFIKLDVEGAEYRVLRGAQELLSSARPIISTEFSCEMVPRVSGIEPRAYLAFFIRYGYGIHIINRGSGRLTEVADIDELLRTWGAWDRIEDLLMLPRGTPAVQP